MSGDDRFGEDQRHSGQAAHRPYPATDRSRPRLIRWSRSFARCWRPESLCSASRSKEKTLRRRGFENVARAVLSRLLLRPFDRGGGSSCRGDYGTKACRKAPPARHARTQPPGKKFPGGGAIDSLANGAASTSLADFEEALIGRIRASPIPYAADGEQLAVRKAQRDRP